MTTPSAEPLAATPPQKPAARWEDFIDIFYAPAAVFRRRQTQSVWPPILVVSALIFIVTYATFGAMAPIRDPIVNQAIQKAMQQNPQMTQEMGDRIRSFSDYGAKYGAAITPLFMLGLALALWLAGKLVGSRQTFHAALVVVSYTMVITVVELLTNGAQALLTDISKVADPYALSLGPARFVGAATISPFVYALLIRLNLFAVWRTVLLSVGLYATGQVSKRNAAIAGLILWLVVLIWQFRQQLTMT